jgi:hypothetical protein
VQRAQNTAEMCVCVCVCVFVCVCVCVCVYTHTEARTERGEASRKADSLHHRPTRLLCKLHQQINHAAVRSLGAAACAVKAQQTAAKKRDDGCRTGRPQRPVIPLPQSQHRWSVDTRAGSSAKRLAEPGRCVKADGKESLTISRESTQRHRQRQRTQQPPHPRLATR